MGLIKKGKEKRQQKALISSNNQTTQAVNSFVEAYALKNKENQILRNENIRLSNIINQQKKVICDYKNKLDRITILLKEITQNNI